ncbi:uncharacterized protein LOC126595446 [Malus sylvestris]|uniref:uncharacterized protein LOC126595446 n=1 Tax=Malus sylvestris TaxID=3752 RepID=UPI0021AC04F0|nr:uncharacterized protein LOC126595446 [Malus sylvestris]
MAGSGGECSDLKGVDEFDAKKKVKEESSDAATLTKKLMKDAKALGLIQGAVSDEIFPWISHKDTSKGAWDILMQEFHGNKQVRSVELQGLRREFEYTKMRDDESLLVYLTKLFNLINQMRSYGEELSRERIVLKMLISLPSTYDSICSVIEHSRDIDVIEVQEVVDSLKSFAQRLGRHNENKTERAFASLIVNSKPANSFGNENNRYQKNWKPKFKKWDKKPTYQFEKQIVAAEVDKKSIEDVWYVDSGCSNHMTGKEDVLVDIDKSITAKVEMGTGHLVNVIGKGSLMVNTKMERRYIKEVMLVSGLKENLLSVVQMMEHGYFLIFRDNKVEIYDDSSLSNLVAKTVTKARNRYKLKKLRSDKGGEYTSMEFNKFCEEMRMER